MADDPNGLVFLDFNDPDAGLLAYAIYGGDLEPESVQPIWDCIDAARENGTKLRLYCELHAMPKPNLSVIGDKLKRLGTIWTHIERMAIVGDQGWLEYYEKIVDPITRFDVRWFPLVDAEEARAWASAPPAIAADP
ncbi:MAG: STAS/SEC14 domain-containing protein [Tateyamaria sp.]|uniref:STAS/SEC14 domain-containing protein n=1 Tax=Tateyamaria sp. TaxID=1929288 RepID=UPI00326A02BE